MSKKSILVTGGLGYIGSHTTVALIERGYKVFIVDDLSNSSIDVLKRIEKVTNAYPDFFKLDLTNSSTVKEFFTKNNNFYGVIHFAAKKSVDESVRNPLEYYHNNIQSLLNILAMLILIQSYFSSSCTVYGQADKLPITEQTPLKKAESLMATQKNL